MNRYEGRTALVTGGGSGIGQACCLRLASEGAAVGVLDIRPEAAEQVAARIRSEGGRAIAVQVDVSDAAAVEAAVGRVVEELGPLRLAVNNAGFGQKRVPPQDISIEDWDRTLAVNVSGVFYCMRAEHPRLLAAGGGAIVNTASVMSLGGSPTGAAYVASKHAVLGLTRSAAMAWGKDNIRVNAVGPGLVLTPFVGAVTEDYRTGVLAQMPLGAFPEPEDIAAMVAFLGSDEAKAITGSLHMVDAGFTA